MSRSTLRRSDAVTGETAVRFISHGDGGGLPPARSHSDLMEEATALCDGTYRFMSLSEYLPQCLPCQASVLLKAAGKEMDEAIAASRVVPRAVARGSRTKDRIVVRNRTRGNRTVLVSRTKASKTNASRTEATSRGVKPASNPATRIVAAVKARESAVGVKRRGHSIRWEVKTSA